MSIKSIFLGEADGRKESKMLSLVNYFTMEMGISMI